MINELKKKKINVALVSSTSEINLLNLFRLGLKIEAEKYFDLIAHGDCTKLKKPSSEIYEWALEKLQLPADACISIEDSPRGLESSSGANIKTIITPSKLTKDENFKGAKLVVSDLGEPKIPFKKISGNNFDYNFVSVDLLKKICAV